MALAIDKNGKVFDKHLTMNEEDIRKVISNTSKADKTKQKHILQRALKTKINREIVS